MINQYLFGQFFTTCMNIKRSRCGRCFSSMHNQTPFGKKATLVELSKNLYSVSFFAIELNLRGIFLKTLLRYEK